MKIIHIVPNLARPSGAYGSSERYSIEMARALAGEVECELLTFGRKDTVLQEQRGLTIRTLSVRNYFGNHFRYPLSLSWVSAQRQADIVHIHEMRSTPGKLAALTAKFFGQKTVATDHSMRGGDWRGTVPLLFDRFLLVSGYSAQLMATPVQRTEIIGGGADPIRFSSIRGQQRKGVLYIGRIAAEKGIDRLIEAMPRDVPLTIAGKRDRQRQGLERDYPRLLHWMARNKKVVFNGPASEEELPDLFRKASIFVLPSVDRTIYGRQVNASDLLGLTALEAMASGTPVICSRIGGLPEIIQEGVNGFLVEPGDTKGLCDRIDYLLANPTAARAMGESGRQMIIERFNWQACANRCLNAYSRLLSPQSERAVSF